MAQTKHTAIWIGVIVGAALAVAIWIAMTRGGGEGQARKDIAGEAGPVDERATAAPVSEPRTQVPRDPDRGDAPTTDRGRRFPAEADRQRLLRAIAAARRAREAAQSEAATPDEPPAAPPRLPARDDDPGLDPEYIRDAVRDALPLIKECYEMALETAPDLSGRLVVEFTISGEAEVGGLVERAQVAGDSPIGLNPLMAECVGQTVLSLEFPAPRGGGVVEVRYPFVFDQTADDDGDSDSSDGNRGD
jgi:hypothetical protein